MNSRRRLALRATTLAVVFLASALPASAARASVPPTPPPSTTAPTTAPLDQDPNVIEESWALAPAGSLDPNEAGNRPELSYDADAGSTIEDAVTLYNFGDVQLTFRVYATDAFNDEQGQFALPPGDVAATGVGTWVSLPQELITVPAGQQATMPITITIPADASPGDHVGAILASSPTLGTGAQGQVLTLDRRTGTRLYVRVNGAMYPELAVDQVDTTYEEALNPLSGSAHVSFRVENRGNVRLGGTATVTVGGPFGLGEKKVSLPDVPELLPGEGITMSVDIADLPATFLAFTTVKVTPTGADGVGDVVVSEGSDTSLAPPYSVLLVMLALLLAYGARRRFRKHRLASLPPEPDQPTSPEREFQLT